MAFKYSFCLNFKLFNVRFLHLYNDQNVGLYNTTYALPANGGHI